MKNKKYKTVIVFGTFDPIRNRGTLRALKISNGASFLHPGHIFFLKSAKKLGTRLIVVVARDEVVQRLKNRTPNYVLRTRMKRLRETGIPYKVTAGDKKEGEYAQLKNHKPDVICLGYDQKALERD